MHAVEAMKYTNYEMGEKSNFDLCRRKAGSMKRKKCKRPHEKDYANDQRRRLESSVSSMYPSAIITSPSRSPRALP